MTVKIYSYDDVGAPVLGTSNDGSLLSILRACLVDGYGTRTAAGWTMPYSDLPNKKAVFKPVASSVNLRLDDNYDYRYAYVRGYGTMSDVDTGTEEFPRDSDLVTGYKYAVSKRYAATAGYEKWHVIADDEYFYFISHHATESNPYGFFFGKMDHVDLTYPNPYVLTGHSVLSTLTGGTGSNSLYSPTEWWVKENYFKTGIPEKIKIFRDNTSYENPNPITGKIEIGVFGELTTTVIPYVRHGRLPNYYQALGISTNIYKSADKIIINTTKYLVVVKGSLLYLFEYVTDAG